MANVTFNVAAAAFGYVDSGNPSTHYTVGSGWYVCEGDSYNVWRGMYVMFSSVPSQYKHYKLTDMQFRIPVQKNNSADAAELFVRYGEETFDPNTITWKTRPQTYQHFCYPELNFGSNTAMDVTAVCDMGDYSNIIQKIAKRVLDGGCISIASHSGAYLFNTRKALVSGSGDLYAAVTVDTGIKSTSHVEYKSGPNSGYANPRNAITFQWEFVKDASDWYCADDSFGQASAVFHWKKSTDANYTDVSISGSTPSVTIPANTFPTASTIQWYVTGTDEDGTTTQTSVFSFSTAAATISATASSPVNSVEDGSAPITFRWNLTSADGYPATTVEGRWKKSSDNSWTTMFTYSGSISSYTAAAGTFPAGEIEWSVRATNIDGTVGSWSAVKSFICVAAPDPVEGLNATQEPRTTISWQSDEQEAYEISIDGAVVQKAFGPSIYSWQVAEPLADGNHTISVRVQGAYGFWSQPVSVTITVANAVPAGWEDIALTGSFDIDAELVLSSPGDGIATPATIHWYRDGERIAVVTYGSEYSGGPFSYTDRRALGTHQYYAELWSAGDGTYARSNVVFGTMVCSAKQISRLDGVGGWLELRLTENSNGSEDYQITQQKATQHVNGAVWPTLERSPFRDLSASYDCAFRDPVEAAAFEALFGQIIILKSRGDEVVIGMLDKLQKKINLFYTSYKFAIQQIHTEGLERYTA